METDASSPDAIERIITCLPSSKRSEPRAGIPPRRRKTVQCHPKLDEFGWPDSITHPISKTGNIDTIERIITCPPSSNRSEPRARIPPRRRKTAQCDPKLDELGWPGSITHPISKTSNIDAIEPH